MAVVEWITGEEYDINTDHIYLNRFSLPYTCIIFSAILYPVIMKRDLSLFIRIGSFGVIFVCIVIVFIFSFGIYSMTNTSFHVTWTPKDEDFNIALFNTGWS